MTKVKTLESNTNDKNEIIEVKNGINELKESMKSVQVCCSRIEEKELCNSNELKTYVHDKIHKLIEKYKNHKHKDINDKIEVIV